ncbi:SDR family oxidoreductase [Kitasatospora sp. CB01950]|uniref:SDR family oxidoreductase n=1 Tax=Kitasatospora sp. CB01950 TaxID=1703930 RepID=UPI0009F848ED|nr:SDR family oxidoreductase [Kitasatospora sp. CB01950]
MTPPRSVVITGATSGIGKATALRMAAAGFEVFATARSPEKAEKLRAEAAEHGLALRTAALDVTDPRACADVFGEIADRTGGGPWAVVNNAGVTLPRAVEDVDEADARHVMEVNVHAPARIAGLVLPAMRARGYGRIVNVSSASAVATLPFAGWYSASKAALSALTHALRMESAPFGVETVLIEPGFHRSAILGHAESRLTVPSRISEHYTACYRTLARAMGDTGRYPGPEPVAEAIHRALTARRPKARYLVGTDARIAARFDALAPYAVSDRLKAVLVGARGSGGRAERLAGRLMGLGPFC